MREPYTGTLNNTLYMSYVACLEDIALNRFPNKGVVSGLQSWHFTSHLPPTQQSTLALSETFSMQLITT